MTKWEHMHAKALHETIEEINGQQVGEFKGIFQGFTGRPSVHEFLEKSGQEGWVVVGICGISETNFWRLILKRPIS